jgi:polyketide cyclase/dehydrase/lipid transport protein
MADDMYTVERSTTIDAPPARIYAQVANFHRWRAWSPWEGLDPDLRRTYTGPDTGSGATYAWAGNRKAGEGRMEITEASEPTRVSIDLQFLKPFKARNETVFDIRPEGSGARVTWAMTGRRTLVTKIMGVFKSMDAMVGPDFERGLASLKATVERSAPA